MFRYLLAVCGMLLGVAVGSAQVIVDPVLAARRDLFATRAEGDALQREYKLLAQKVTDAAKKSPERAAAMQGLAEAQKQLKAVQAPVLDKLHNSPEYLEAVAQAEKLKAALQSGKTLPGENVSKILALPKELERKALAEDPAAVAAKGELDEKLKVVAQENERLKQITETDPECLEMQKKLQQLLVQLRMREVVLANLLLAQAPRVAPAGVARDRDDDDDARDRERERERAQDRARDSGNRNSGGGAAPSKPEPQAEKRTVERRPRAVGIPMDLRKK